MTTLSEPFAKKIAKLIRLLSSDFEGEILNVVARIKQVLAAGGMSFHDIATVIENCDGEVEERKWSDSDAKAIYERGKEKGVGERQEDGLEFYDADAQPRWYEIAVFNQRNVDRLLGSWEKDFSNDMPSRMLWNTPSHKQAQQMLRIFVKLGGYCDPKVKARYF